MTLSARLNDPQWRALPTVWIKRLVINESVSGTKLRDVRLTTGMNIVWGLEVEGTDDVAFQPGHGLGKTSFCRLLRFCLGEKTFGQPKTVKGVQHAYPDGFVEAEIVVDGVTWCVRRFFAPGHASYARQSESLRSYRSRKPDQTSDPYKAFRDCVQAVTLKDFDEIQLLSQKRHLRWHHLLAMCSRDQENRYLKMLDWRSARSEAELMGFSQPKADAIRCVLAMLRIYTDKDRAIEDQLHEATTKVNSLKDRKTKATSRLQFWDEHYREVLDKAGVEGAIDKPLDASSLFGLQQTYRDVLNDRVVKIARLDQEIAGLEAVITNMRASLRESEEFREGREATSETVTEPIEREMANHLNLRRQLEEMQRQMKEKAFSLCVLGNIAYRKCEHVQLHRDEIDNALAEVPAELPADVQQKAKVVERINQLVERLRTSESKIREAMDIKIGEKEKLERKRRSKERKKDDLEKAWEELMRIDSVLKENATDKSLSPIVSKLSDANGELDTAKAEKKDATAAHRKDLHELETVFDFLAQRCVTSDYRGVVDLTEDDITFQILHGETGSGEGFEMLAILLGDLAIAVLGAALKASHPGLLIHDSPREADLGPAAYRQFLHSTHHLLDSLAQDSDIPIQYIVTTTTPPPKSLRTRPTTVLRLGGKHGPLFGKSLKTASPPSQLPLPSDQKDEKTKEAV